MTLEPLQLLLQLLDRLGEFTRPMLQLLDVLLAPPALVTPAALATLSVPRFLEHLLRHAIAGDRALLVAPLLVEVRRAPE